MFWEIFQHCLSKLEEIVNKCEATNLVLDWEKFHFMVQEAIALGHRISKKGFEVDKAKIVVIEPPTNAKRLKRFLDILYGLFWRFIKDFSKISNPMCQLLQHDTLFVFDATNT